MFLNPLLPSYQRLYITMYKHAKQANIIILHVGSRESLWGRVEGKSYHRTASNTHSKLLRQWSMYSYMWLLLRVTRFVLILYWVSKLYFTLSGLNWKIKLNYCNAWSIGILVKNKNKNINCYLSVPFSDRCLSFY